MAAVAFQDGFSQFFDNSGNPLAGGLVYTYAAGTTTNQATYTTQAGTVAHANPVVLDSAGRASIFLGQGLSYRMDLKTSAGVLIKSVDNIAAGGAASAEFQSEIQTATDGQTVFNLASISYTPGNYSLKVYEDGVLLEPTTDYTETSATRVTLTAVAASGARFTFWAGADSSPGTEFALLAGGNQFTGSQAVTFTALTDGTNIAVDASLSNNFRVTLGGNRTLDNPTNLKNGMTLNFRIKQDATGTRTLAFGSKYKWPGGSVPPLSPAANAVDLICAQYEPEDDILLCNMLRAFA